jgi:hypothetical protein
MSALSDLVAKANGGDLTHRQVAQRARDLGAPISDDTAWKVMSGRHGALKDPALRAFATVFPSLTFEALRAAADLPVEDLGPYQPPDGADRLGARERAAVDELIRLLTAPRPARAAEPSNVRDLPARPEKLDRLAARKPRGTSS